MSKKRASKTGIAMMIEDRFGRGLIEGTNKKTLDDRGLPCRVQKTGLDWGHQTCDRKEE